MLIPEREKKTKEDIIEYMKKCAKQYVPEWRFEQDHPDAGTALVSLFADMMYENIRKFNLTATKDLFSFFDEVNAKMLPASPAEGFITFELPGGAESVEEVPAGTKLLADTEEGQMVFETQDEVLVRHMDVSRIFLSSPKEDAIYQVFSEDTDEKPSFFLFQDTGENLQKHRIFFCFDRGLEIRTGADARLTLETASTTVEKEKLAQAMLDPEKILFSYGTEKGFRVIKNYSYKNGTLKFDIAGGENGIIPSEEFDSMYVLRADIMDAELFSQVYLTSASLVTRCRGCRPDLIHVNGTDQEQEDFPAFGEAPALYNEFYIASEEVLGKAGAKIRLEFDLDFVKIPLEEFLAEKIEWKTIMKKRDFVPDKEYDISIREVVWEYYNGYGWKRLPVSGGFKDIFAAEENLRGQRKKMEFICPADIERVLVNSTETYCIRARIMKMNNAYKTKGAYIVPVAGRVSLGYDFKNAPLKPVHILRQNNMEYKESTAEEMMRSGFAVPMGEASPDKNTSCYFGFRQPPFGGPLKMLFVMHDTMQREMPLIEWEYLGEEGWTRMNLIDGTKSFHHTGLISWFGRQDIRKTRIFGEELFWIRMTDRQEAYQNRMWKDICPRVEGIYPNSTRILGIETLEEIGGLDPYAEKKQIELPYAPIAGIEVRVMESLEYGSGSMHPVWTVWKEVEELREDSAQNREFTVRRQEGIVEFPKYMKVQTLDEREEIAVRIRYEHCRGAEGNLKAGAVSRLERSIGYISGCVNPLATVCGTEGETPFESVQRSAKILRHGYRCVSAGDFEDMAWEATRNISKVKCFTGYDQFRRKQPGAVTLVVMPKDGGEGNYGFEKMRMQIYDYLASHMDDNIVNLKKFYVVWPERIRLDVKVSIEPERRNEIFPVRRAVLSELNRFLDPICGNFHGQGWEICTLPNTTQIINGLKGTAGVKQINQLTLRKYRRGRFEEYEVTDEKLSQYYLLPKSGNHEILIEI